MKMKTKRIVIFTLVIVFSMGLFGGGAIEVDTDKTREPISKYIYGQFIEHMGKCIYGGIWAEKIKDRKFNFQVTPNYEPYDTTTDDQWNTGPYKYLAASPWQIVGDPETVDTDSSNSYVGKYTPVVHAEDNDKAQGIRQYHLDVEEGQAYTGRIILSGEKSVLPIKVKLITGDKVAYEKINKISSNYEKYPIDIFAPSSCENAKLEIISKGEGNFKIGTISLMPSDNIKGWNKEVVKKMKKLDSPIYRWPGGNFVSGYNWRDGIGKRDKRPPRTNPAWTGVESNDVGLHEYMELMEILNSEAFICVNTGLGTVEEVAEQVEYVNGAKDTEMGQLRAKNGHPDPYDVKYWAVGNEMFGDWQLGHMPLSDYVKKHKKVVNAMLEQDEDIELVGVGAIGEWSKTMLSEASDYMDLISEHIYFKQKDSLLAHTAQLADEIERRGDIHRKYRRNIEGLPEKDIEIAMDEWNFWYGDYLYGELGVRYHMKDALGIARGYHEFFRNSDLYFMANYAQTVNVIGAIKRDGTEVGFAATAMPQILYRHHFGKIPVDITGDTGRLDISAALTKDKEAVTVAVVNPTPRPKTVKINLNQEVTSDKVKKWVIHNPDPESYNVPGQKPEIDIVEQKDCFKDGKLKSEYYSITIYKLKLG